MFKFQSKISKISRFASVSFRIAMVIILLLTACGPASPKDQPAEVLPSVENTSSNPPVPEPKYFDAPNIEIPDRNSPEPDAPVTQLPPEPETEPVQFTVTASPAIVEVNGEVTLSVVIRNRLGAELSGLVYSDSLENGLSFVSSSENVKFESGMVSFAIASIPNNKDIIFSYTLKVTIYVQKTRINMSAG